MIRTAQIINSTDRLSHIIISIEGTHHGSSWIFDQCMRAFTGLNAEAITFSVFFNAPVMKRGIATIHRDGAMELRTTEGGG